MKNLECTTTQSLTLFDLHAGERWTGPWELPVFRIELVKERSLSGPVVCSPAEAAAVLCEYLRRADREHFVVLLLSAANQVIGLNTVHVGTLTATLVSARDVFKPAILANAHAVVVAHNHPSGSLTPSQEDIAVTKRLVDVGRLLDIAVLDSIIVGHDGRYVSLASRGLLG